MKLREAEDVQQLFKDAARILRQDGLVCFPCHGHYRLAASLESQAAVMNLLQSKHRVGKAPALVFVPNASMLDRVASEVSPLAERLARAFWPGPLTIQFAASSNLPPKVVKQLARATGRIGVRITDDPIASGIVEAFGGPLLISSANRERKSGDVSPAQVRKNFVHQVDLFIEAGDLVAEPHSTVITLDGDQVKVVRAGVIDEAMLAEAAAL